MGEENNFPHKKLQCFVVEKQQHDRFDHTENVKFQDRKLTLNNEVTHPHESENMIMLEFCD